MQKQLNLAKSGPGHLRDAVQKTAYYRNNWANQSNALCCNACLM